MAGHNVGGHEADVVVIEAAASYLVGGYGGDGIFSGCFFGDHVEGFFGYVSHQHDYLYVGE